MYDNLNAFLIIFSTNFDTSVNSFVFLNSGIISDILLVLKFF